MMIVLELIGALVFLGLIGLGILWTSRNIHVGEDDDQASE